MANGKPKAKGGKPNPKPQPKVGNGNNRRRYTQLLMPQREKPDADFRGALDHRLVEHLRGVNSSEVGYLYGFVDPDFADRGPAGEPFQGRVSEPTEMARYTSRVPMTFHRPSGPQNGFDVTGVVGNDFFTDASGNALIVVSPSLIQQSVLVGESIEPTGNPQFVAGFAGPAQSDGDANNWTAPLMEPSLNAQSGSPSLPFGTFIQGNPIGLNLTLGTANINSTVVPYRTGGLRATLANTFPALNTQGAIAGGDGGDFYGNPGSDGVVTTTIGNNASLPDSALPVDNTFNQTILPNPAAYQPIGAGQYLSRVAQLDSLTSECRVFECSFLPLNDRVLRYTNSPLLYSTASVIQDEAPISLISYSSKLTALQNQPSCMFFLQGLADGQTFVLDVTWAIEFQVPQNSPIAFMYNSARFSVRYPVDWTVTSRLQSAGKLGHVLSRHIAMDGPLGGGYIAHVATARGIPLVQTRLPETRISGAISGRAAAEEKVASNSGFFDSVKNTILSNVGFTPKEGVGGVFKSLLGNALSAGLKAAATYMLPGGAAIAPFIPGRINLNETFPRLALTAPR